jgi:hypothetical protein
MTGRQRNKSVPDPDELPDFGGCIRCRFHPCLGSVFDENRELHAQNAELCRDLTAAQELIATLESRLTRYEGR